MNTIFFYSATHLLMLRNFEFCHSLVSFLSVSNDNFFGQEKNFKLFLHLCILTCNSAHYYAAYDAAWKQFSKRNVVCC